MRFLWLYLACFITLNFFDPGLVFSAGREEAAAAAAQPRLEAKFEGQPFKLGDPVFIRIFKEESKLELWLKPAGSDKFKLFHTYPICSWSGSLGPKTRQGDRQAPEGFYAVGLKHLNPYSNYHLAFNLGYPNAYDKAQGYTGDLLMVHGDCRSDGCYAMTDKGIEEIYTIVKASLDNGQPFFRVHSFPFQLSADKLKRAHNHKWYKFWASLSPIYEYFEANRFPPEVVVEGGEYKLKSPM